jgi:phage terminase large subunit-like protein
VDTPGYAALVLRRTYADLAKPGALMDRAKEYLHGTGATWNERDKQWRFPSGAVISFGYLQHEDDKLQYKSAEFQYIAFDELTDFTESQYTFLFTRLRKKAGGPLAGVPLRMRSASNPGGPGHSWVKARFVDPASRRPGAVFVPAGMRDNPHLDVAGYEESLQGTDPLTREQIKAGNWDAVATGRFKPEWFRDRYRARGDYLVLQRADESAERTYRVWDLLRFVTCDPAASAKTTADWTVAGVWAITPRNELVLLDLDRFQAGIVDIPPRLMALHRKWQTAGVWVEGVAANDGVYQLCAATAMPARRLTPLGQDKLVRATKAMNYAATGRIWLPAPGVRPGVPLDVFEAELYRFTGDDRVDDHDDCVDVLAYSAWRLDAGPGPGADQRPQVLGGGR